MKTKSFKPDDLIPYARNPRHNDHAVEELAAAIKEFGFRVPILCSFKSHVVTDGHLRLKAAKYLKLKSVPCVDSDDMTEAQIKAFRISVNKMAEKAEWDFEMLRIEIDELADMDFDLDLTGFDADEIAGFSFDEDPETELPELNSDDRQPFQTMTFTLHDDQVEEVKRAMEGAKAMGPYGDTGNENGNGNALARIAEMFNANFGGPE